MPQEGIADTLPRKEIPQTEQKHPVRIFKITQPILRDSPQVTDEVKSELSKFVESPIKRLSGGTSKETYTDQEQKKVIQLLVQPDNPRVKKQVSDQVSFYLQNKDNPLFQKLVVPAEDIIQNQSDEAVGMIQPFFGMSLQEYRQKGYQLDQSTVDTFIEDYKELIKQTGIVHGDFAFGKNGTAWTANWDSVRIDPITKQLRFIDYNGHSQGISHGSDIVHLIENPQTNDEQQENAKYQEYFDKETEYTQQVLYQFFGIKPHTEETIQAEVQKTEERKSFIRWLLRKEKKAA